MRSSVFDRLCAFGCADTRFYSYDLVYDPETGYPQVLRTNRVTLEFDYVNLSFVEVKRLMPCISRR